MPGRNIKFLEKSPVKLNFTKKSMTAYGGFGVLAKLFEKLDLKENVERMFPVVERSPNSAGIYSKVLRFGLTVLAGGKRFSDCLFLGQSHEIYEQTFGVKRMVHSVSALTRFFGRFTSWQKSEQLAEEMWRYTYDRVIQWEQVLEDYLTLDSSTVTRYGKQEGAKKGYNPKKKGRRSHHPLLAFLNRSGYVVNLWNRSGDTSSGNGCVEFAKETIARLGDRLKIKGFLADSGFYLIEMIKYLELLGIEYIIAAPLTHVLQRAILRLGQWQWVARGIEIAEFEFEHADEKWDRPRRYVVVRQRVVAGEDPPAGRQLFLFQNQEAGQRYRYGIYITSSQKTAEEVWRTYRLRAADENIIKEFKQDFALEGFCLDKFYATEAAMLTRALFYNIITLFRRLVMPKGESRVTLQTLRLRYLVIPAFFGSDGKTPVLRIGTSSRSLRQKIIWIINRLDCLFGKRIAFGGGPAMN